MKSFLILSLAASTILVPAAQADVDSASSPTRTMVILDDKAAFKRGGNKHGGGNHGGQNHGGRGDHGGGKGHGQWGQGQQGGHGQQSGQSGWHNDRGNDRAQEPQQHKPQKNWQDQGRGNNHDRDRGGDDQWRDDRNGNNWDRYDRHDRDDRNDWRRNDRHEYRGDDWRRNDRNDDRRRDRNDRDEHRWDNGWRNDDRYNWRGHRDRYRDHYRRGHYNAPDRYHRYSRYSIGVYVGAPFYHQNYWLNDPWHYRLPPVHGFYRWVRYYDDVLLVDVRNGYVVDVINDFFW